MAAKKRSESPKNNGSSSAHIEGGGAIVRQPITQALEINYMPYAMSVILSRAIPEIDGFKPSHRKILYMMYKMNLLGGGRTKSANIVGQTMRLNPHGDAAIYDTMVRLSRGYEALLYPLVDSKGNFGKAYSRDMAWAAARYTEAKLESICHELFDDIDKDTVDFVDNYDSTMKEPQLLPVTFPSILVNSNTGIAVGMASSICSFNLKEICETTIALMGDPNKDPSETMMGPDFPGGGLILYDREELAKIYQTGRGSVKVRSRYAYDAKSHCIDITEIPPTTTCEAIIDKVIEHVKAGRIKEIADIRDETGKDGLKITIDLKRGVDADKLMQRLYKITPLQDSFSCNFNVLVSGTPRVLGLSELLLEWVAFRMNCVKRRTYYQKSRASERLHLLKGLSKILLDIDKAIRIVRETEEEAEVVPNLMIGFAIDEVQAEYVAEIKLRHLNREYILKRTAEMGKLEAEIAELTAILADDKRVRDIIEQELRKVMEKYNQPRKSKIIFLEDIQEEPQEEQVPDYAVQLFFTKEGYFKKITPLSLRMSGEHKLKVGDVITQNIESSNNTELLFFTDQQQVYKCRASDFEDTKSSVLGEYIPAKLGMEENESAIYMAATKDYGGYMFFFFDNGKMAKVDMSAYQTKTNRRKLMNAYSDRSPLAAILYAPADCEVLMQASSGKMLLVNTGSVNVKATKDTQGVQVMTLRKGQRIIKAAIYREGDLENPTRYRTKTLPKAGITPAQEDMGVQLKL